jgi:proteasome lid subunit RPN8/RPN11
MMRISADLLAQIVAHAQEDPTIECCGVVAVEPGSPARAVGVYPITNMHASALKFEMDPDELLKRYKAILADGMEIGAIYHSHVRSPPYPSQTDVNFARLWPGSEWIIVGLANGQAPEVRSYLIQEGEVKEMRIPETVG